MGPNGRGVCGPIYYKQQKGQGNGRFSHHEAARELDRKKLLYQILGDVQRYRWRNEEITINTFKLGLPIDSGLRRSLIKRPPTSLAKLMNKIDQYVRLEEDRKEAIPMQTAAQPKVIVAKSSARSTAATKNLSAPSNFVAPTFRAFETIFKEPIYKIMEKIKREPFFV